MMTIECTLPVDYQDEGPWRSYEFHTQGETLVELLGNATISEIDQDGGEICTYDIGGALDTVAVAAIDTIESYLLNKIEASAVTG